VTERPLARDAWRVLEPYHAVCYFADEPRTLAPEAGLRGFWMGYFAGRAAPMGAVGAGVVTATFYGFHPARVERAIPDAWTFASPDAVLTAKLALVERALRRVVGPVADGTHLQEAARLAGEVADACDVGARPLAAAWASTDVPDSPLLALWRAATVLREHRGDGHVFTLATAGVGPCESHVMMAAAGYTTRDVVQPARGWSDDDWDTAVAGLQTRGWVDADGALTAAGQEVRRTIEAETDRLATTPYAARGEDAVRRLIDLVAPLADAITAEMWFPNPIGLTARRESTGRDATR
jgi:hypothetical protein